MSLSRSLKRCARGVYQRAVVCTCSIVAIASIDAIWADASAEDRPLTLQARPPAVRPASGFGELGYDTVPVSIEVSSIEAEGARSSETIRLFRVPVVGRLVDAGYQVGSAAGGRFGNLDRRGMFLDYALPWSWSPSQAVDGTVILRLEVGTIGNSQDTRLLGAVGPTLRLDFYNWRIPAFVDLGISPTFVDGSNYGNLDFGTSLNFTSHMAIGFRFGANSSHRFGVRYEHISNGGINKINPGVNMTGIEVVLWARDST